MWPIQPVSPHLLIVLLRAFGRPSEQQPPRCAPFEGSSKSSLESFYERLSNEGTRRANWNQKIDRFSQNGICLWNQKISIYIYHVDQKAKKKKSTKVYFVGLKKTITFTQLPTPNMPPFTPDPLVAAPLDLPIFPDERTRARSIVPPLRRCRAAARIEASNSLGTWRGFPWRKPVGWQCLDLSFESGDFPNLRHTPR